MCENLVVNFYAEVTYPEARQFYGMQIAMEGIHSETYSLLIDALVHDGEARMSLFDAVNTHPTVSVKAAWAMKWLDKSTASFAERLVAFACVEGIFFSSSFCAIFYLKKRGISMDGLSFSNELISRDEGLHCDFACLLYSKLDQKLSHTRLCEIVGSCVDCEKSFVRDALSLPIIGMNATLMCAYVEFVADRLLVELGAPRLYGTPNPFNFMAMLSLNGKTNFFEKRVGEYAKANVGCSGTGKDGFSKQLADDCFDNLEF